MPARPLALTLAAALLLGGTGALVGGAGVSSAAEPVRLGAGTTPATAPFPTDALTVADPAQVTGRRVALPTAGCDASGRSLCDDLALINTLDGFDLQPRVVLPFTGDVDLLSVTPATVYVEGPGGRTGLVQLVGDPASHAVAGRTDAVLAPATTYTLVVTSGVKASDGTPVDVGPGGERRVAFTTMSATNTLDRLRAALDDDTAYEAAGIPVASRVLAFDAVAGMTRSVFNAKTVARVDRQDQTFVDPEQPKTASQVLDPIRAASGFYGFGSIRSPQYTSRDGVIAPFPSGSTPRPVRAAQIGVTMAAPAPSPLPGASCIQPVVFGPGFSRSKYDLFLSGDTFPQRGAALFATDPLGHAFGPQSTFSVTTTTAPAPVTGTGFGRAVDVDGDGRYGNTEGVGPSFSVKKDAQGNPVRTEAAGRDYSNNTTPDQPSKDAAVLLRDGLIQTVVDNMALVRAVEKGVDIDGDGKVDTCTGSGAVAYFGQSFGGIYGTMLLGTDPHVTVGVPNVPGANVTDIARLSGFRLNAARTLQANSPNLLNGGPGLLGFTESLPLRRDPRVDRPVPGALPIQDLLARADWVSRSGDPSAYAARLGRNGTFASKKILLQVAYADGTVPNPTSGTLLRAGDLYDRTWVYRNDRTPTFDRNPHGFLLDPQITGRSMGQDQIQQFITSRGATEVDPDGNGPVWEKDPALYRAQLDCLHYPDPQTGQPQTRVMGGDVCTDRSGTLATAPAPGPSSMVPGLPVPVPGASSAPTPTPSATPTSTTTPPASPTASPSASASPTASPAPAAATPTVAVRPRTITAKQSALVTGTTRPGATVELFAYSRPSTTYARVRTATADSSGAFTFTVAPSGNTRLYVRSGGLTSDSTVLLVRTDLNLKVTRTGTRTYRFTGSTLPKRVGQLVTVFYEVPGSGKRVIASRARVSSTGTYDVTRQFGSRATYDLSTGTGVDNDNAAGTSPKVRVSVR